MSITRIKGFADMFPPESDTFTRLENTAREVFFRYGFVELRTPIVEFTELFQRSIGEETDVVQKEMYTFADRKGRSLTLRPEATAGVMRAYIEAGLVNREAVSRLFTTGPMFRYERPQKGRMRQFHQINCECLGSHSPYTDAELISMLLRFLGALGLRDLTLKLNSLGCAQCPRSAAGLSGRGGQGGPLSGLRPPGGDQPPARAGLQTARLSDHYGRGPAFAGLQLSGVPGALRHGAGPAHSGGPAL